MNGLHDAVIQQITRQGHMRDVQWLIDLAQNTFGWVRKGLFSFLVLLCSHCECQLNPATEVTLSDCVLPAILTTDQGYRSLWWINKDSSPLLLSSTEHLSFCSALSFGFYCPQPYWWFRLSVLNLPSDSSCLQWAEISSSKMFDVSVQPLGQLAMSCGIDYYENVESSTQQGAGSNNNSFITLLPTQLIHAV